MSDRIPALLEPIQNRLNAITPGPWFASRYYIGAGADQSDPDAEVAKASSKIDAAFIAAAPTDQARLLAAVQAVTALHKPYAICDPCECTDHPEEYEYIDCGEYNGCERTISGWACGECCSDAMWFNTEECATNHRHTMDKDARCPTVAAVVAALGGEA